VAQQGIEMILTRRLATQLTMPILLVDPRGDLVFFNAGAASVLGRSFEDTGAIQRGEWSAHFQPSNPDGSPMKREEQPLFVATERREPCCRVFGLRGLDGVARQVQSIAFPLIGQGERMLGGVGVFWDRAAPPQPGTPHVGAPLDLASPGADRPIELLLMRQLASYLATVIVLVDPEGNLLFFNEPAEQLLGRRFDEVDPMGPQDWVGLLESIDESGHTIPFDERPLIIALKRQQPAHQRFSIRGFDQVVHAIEGLAFPLVGGEGRQLGAVGIFWEHAQA